VVAIWELRGVAYVGRSGGKSNPEEVEAVSSRYADAAGGGEGALMVVKIV